MGLNICRSIQFPAADSQAVINSPPSVAVSLVLPAEERLIERSWQLVGDPSTLGVRIFDRIFIQFPELLETFGLQDVPLDQLTYHPIFVKHAARFTQFLEAVVSSVHDKVVTTRLAQRNGERHVLIGQGSGSNRSAVFKQEYWSHFAEATAAEITAAVGQQMDAHLVEEAWMNLLRQVVSEMQRELNSKHNE